MSVKVHRFMRRPAVLEATGFSRSRLDEKIRLGEFPAPFKLTDSGRAVAWLEDDVVAWQYARLATREEPVEEHEPASDSPAFVSDIS